LLNSVLHEVINRTTDLFDTVKFACVAASWTFGVIMLANSVCLNCDLSIVFGTLTEISNVLIILGLENYQIGLSVLLLFYQYNLYISYTYVGS